MTTPSSPTSQSFEIPDLRSLAQATIKTFQRLAPYSQLQDPSSPEVVTTLNMITRKIAHYIDALDASIAAVHFLHRISKDATALHTEDVFPSSEKTEKASSELSLNGGEKEKKASNSRSPENASLSESFELPDKKARLDRIARLANDAVRNSEKAEGAFRHADQDFYKIAAATKDMVADHTVNIPVDPSLPRTIVKPLCDIGPDLVSSLSLLSSYSKQLSNLNTCCTGIRTEIEAEHTILPSLVSPPAIEIQKKWATLLVDTLTYRTLISDLRERNGKLLPLSEAAWQTVVEEKVETHSDRQSSSGDVGRKRKKSIGARILAILKAIYRFLRKSLRHLACRGNRKRRQ